MTQVLVTQENKSVLVDTGEKIVFPRVDVRVISAGVQGPSGPSGGGSSISGDCPVFVQDTAPSYAGAYVWWDTSGGNLTVWIEDGL